MELSTKMETISNTIQQACSFRGHEEKVPLPCTDI